MKEAEQLTLIKPTYEASPGPAITHLGELATCASCAGENTRLFRPGSPADRPAITSPEAAADVFVPLLSNLDREHCVMASLDTKHRMIGAATVSIGSVEHTFMSPREIYRDALLLGATAIVLAHNHPSGEAEPSRDDQAVTKRLNEAGDLLGVNLLDHLVIGAGQWVSLARRGAL